MKNKSGCSRIIAFCNREHAEQFREYVIYHRSHFNMWPIVDASNSVTYTEKQTPNPTVERISKHVLISSMNDDDVDTAQHVNFVHATHFEYNKETNVLSLKGYEDFVQKIDIEKIRSTLERYL